jgi:nucleoside-diphosphate-sugar epimerase
MSLHVVVGSGPIGSGVATLLADAGEQVRVVTRRGTGPNRPEVELVAADAADASRMRPLAHGAAALYNCANPPYHRWPVDWPPIASSLLSAAESAGAVLVTTSNLYGYGPVDRPMTEDMPLAATGRKGRVRAQMWHDALAAHKAGRVRVTEARASDYIGPRADSLVSRVVVPAVLSGRTAWVPANLDAPHSFTYVDDMARTLVTIAGDERAWGRAWHVPTPPPVTIRQLAAELARLAGLPAGLPAGRPAPRLVRIPAWVVSAVGLFNPPLREFAEVSYQFQRPFVVDSSRTTETFGLTATDLGTALAATIAGTGTTARG